MTTTGGAPVPDGTCGIDVESVGGERTEAGGASVGGEVSDG